MNEKNKIHEATEDPTFNPITQVAEEDTIYVDEQLKPIQQIVGGGPPKKVHLEVMPKPVRYFGYFYVFIVPIIMIAVIIISFIK